MSNVRNTQKKRDNELPQDQNGFLNKVQSEEGVLDG